MVLSVEVEVEGFRVGAYSTFLWSARKVGMDPCQGSLTHNNTIRPSGCPSRKPLNLNLNLDSKPLYPKLNTLNRILQTLNPKL